MKPTKVEFQVGETIHKQPLRIVYMLDGGKHQWVLFKEGVSQRDENQAIYGLTGEAILAMAEAVKQMVSESHLQGHSK